MYHYMIAQAAGEKAEAESFLSELESMENQEWCWAVTIRYCNDPCRYNIAMSVYNQNRRGKRFLKGKRAFPLLCESL